MWYRTKQEIIELTSKWEGDRFEDGRPKVPAEIINELYEMTLEELWLPLYVKGYKFQYTSGLKVLHEGKKLIGRAVTCTFMPTRPDLRENVYALGRAKGYEGTCNQWVVDNLVEGDVLVADMYDKVYNGTFVGGNLTQAINSRTKTGGAIIYGGVRDIEQMQKLDTQVYYRGVDPTPIRECDMISYNAPCRIEESVCLPGDIVMGTVSGVLFIPAHMLGYAMNHAKKTHAKDIFGFEMLDKKIYTTAQIDDVLWSEDMVENLVRYVETDKKCEKYRNLDWSLEIDASKGKTEAVNELLQFRLI